MTLTPRVSEIVCSLASFTGLTIMNALISLAGVDLGGGLGIELIVRAGAAPRGEPGPTPLGGTGAAKDRLALRTRCKILDIAVFIENVSDSAVLGARSARRRPRARPAVGFQDARARSRMPRVRSEHVGGNLTSPGRIERPTGALKTLDGETCWAATGWPKRRLAAAGTGSCFQLTNVKHALAALGRLSLPGLGNDFQVATHFAP